MEETHDGTGPFVRAKYQSNPFTCKAKWHFDNVDKSSWKHYYLRVRLHWSGLVDEEAPAVTYWRDGRMDPPHLASGPSDIVMWYGPLDWDTKEKQ